MSHIHTKQKDHNSNGDTQKALENEIRQMLSEIIGIGTKYYAQKLILGDGVTIDIDAVCESADEMIAVEIYCHLGSLKASQRKKLLTDSAKLSLVKSARAGTSIRSFVVLAGDESNRGGLGKCSWHTLFFKTHGINFHHHLLTEDQQFRLRQAMSKQRMGNSTPYVQPM